MSTIIIISPPPTKPKRIASKTVPSKANSYEVDVGDEATDLEALKALVLKLESEQE